MEKIIISQITGGIGNQLFQYAFAKKLALETGASLLLDTNLYKRNFIPKRDLELFLFPVQAENLSEEHWQKLSDTILFLEEECNLYYEEINVENFDIPLYCKGYWQSWKYFISIETLLRKELCFDMVQFSERVVELSELLSNSLSVGIHIRRTDYAMHPHLGILPISYYHHAIDYFIQKNQKNTEFSFFVFSDDPTWVETNFTIPVSYQIIKGNTGIEDLFLMSRCRNNIIANSSYSWWAAWLNPNPAKIVVVPQFWKIGEGLDVENTDLIPPEWISVW